ncbi:MAG: 3-hydroxyanthranilate 3,4-dioxygenase [Elusimicrobia bacterium]|nr:3-hydroxyanthranilate 3,4-dioxygenase [Elusimicrobiota bacterium]
MTARTALKPLNLNRWIEEHKHLLKPPVGNANVWEDRDFMVTIVGGPNSRTDYHIDESEEFFYQIKGDIVLKIIEDGKVVDLPISEGEIFLLPPKVPHSPRRPADTIGLVIERKRAPNEKDGLLWLCPKCGEKLFEDFFHLTDLTTQLQPVFERFYKSHATCKKCGTVVKPPHAKD